MHLHIMFFCVFFIFASGPGGCKNTIDSFTQQTADGSVCSRPSHHARLDRKLIRKEVGYDEPTLIGPEIIGILLWCLGL